MIHQSNPAQPSGGAGPTIATSLMTSTEKKTLNQRARPDGGIYP